MISTKKADKRSIRLLRARFNDSAKPYMKTYNIFSLQSRLTASAEQTEAILAVAAQINTANETAKRYEKQRF